MGLNWNSARLHPPLDGEEVLAVVTGEHDGLRYDHEVVSAVYDQGCWYLDDGIADGKGISVSEWMPRPGRESPAPEPVRLDGNEVLNRLILISASAARWSGPRVIQEAIAEVRGMIAGAK